MYRNWEETWNGAFLSSARVHDCVQTQSVQEEPQRCALAVNRCTFKSCHLGFVVKVEAMNASFFQPLGRHLCHRQ